VFANLKNIMKPSLIGVGCPAHVLNNCIQHGTDTLEIEIEPIVLKVYNYFSIYTLRVEFLKNFVSLLTSSMNSCYTTPKLAGFHYFLQLKDL